MNRPNIKIIKELIIEVFNYIIHDRVTAILFTMTIILGIISIYYIISKSNLDSNYIKDVETKNEIIEPFVFDKHFYNVKQIGKSSNGICFYRVYDVEMGNIVYLSTQGYITVVKLK